MQYLKPAVRPLTAQGDLIKNKGCGQRGCGVFQVLDHCSFFEPERRLRRSMKSIFPRCHRDVMQSGQVWLRGFATSGSIPAEPGGTWLRQRTLGANMANRKSESMT